MKIKLIIVSAKSVFHNLHHPFLRYRLYFLAYQSIYSKMILTMIFQWEILDFCVQ